MPFGEAQSCRVGSARLKDGMRGMVMAHEACCIARQAPGVNDTPVDASLAPAQHRLYDQNAPQSLHHWLSALLRQLQSPQSPQHTVLL